jgi:hypothetical protein
LWKQVKAATVARAFGVISTFPVVALMVVMVVMAVVFMYKLMKRLTP